MPQSSPALDWCFTINNPLEKHWDRVWDMDYKYLVFQLEMGEQGRPHLQGFVQFHEKQRLTALKKLVGRSVHWEKRRGTPYEAADYCKKEEGRLDDSYYEDGTISAQPQVRVHEVATTIKEHGLTRAIERFPDIYMGMARGMQALETFYSPVRDFKTDVTILWGNAGCGKSRYAMEVFPTPYMVPSFGEGTDFFGDYRPRQHQTVVVDDFYSSWKYTTWLRVCDRYPTEVHTKGGYLQFLAHDIVFTSNMSPDKWYPKIMLDPVRKASFIRRITNIVEFTSFGVYIVRKGNLPYPALPWMRQMNVNEALMNPPVPQNNPVLPVHPQVVDQDLQVPIHPLWTEEQMDDGPQLVDVHPPSFPRSAFETRAAWFRAHGSNRQ